MNFTRCLAITALFFCLQTQAFTGSDTCRDCHAQEYDNWRGSHHDLAMQIPTAETVLGNFDNATFTHNGVSTRFSKRGDKYIVNTDGEDGKPTDFEVAYVFGVEPLQQYLLPLTRGRLQALSIAWDTRPKGQGGQRWFHLHGDEAIDYQDPLHWTGPYYNWNSRCAECHSTDLQKNYDSASNSFSTSFEEIDVACEACHGPGDNHLELAKANAIGSAPHGGFPTDLAQRGKWALPEGGDIARRTQPPESNAQIDSCGRCHARRGTLGQYHYGVDLLDTHRLALPQPPLYYPDGQILDEVYVYGSFVQSKMHRAGVVCSNCHEPHSLELRAPGNGVCAQCHAPAEYDSPSHHHHEQGSTGASCANCHMPETTYMVVDPRRDHSMRIPRPDLSLVVGVPNACNQCHSDKDAEWALEATRDWGVNYYDTASHPARAFHNFELGDMRAVPRLAQLANDSSAAPIWRATAMEALGRAGGRETMQTVAAILYDDNPLIRASTVRSLDFMPPGQRFQLLSHLIDDNITSVRMAVAESLAQTPLEQLSPADGKRLAALFEEYEEILAEHADMPETQMQLGMFRIQRGDSKGAESAYRQAIKLNPQLIPARLNLADLMRSQGREQAARAQLHKALEIVPEHGPALHAMGLLETRSGNSEKALDYLSRAAAVETNSTRHRFVYAIALHDLGQPEEAINQLEALLRDAPSNEEALLALTNYNAELGRRKQALRHAAKLTSIAPQNRNYRQLYQQLSR